MATTAGYQERIAAFARQLSEEMGEVDASKGVCWLDSIENQAIEITNAVHAELLKQRSNDYPPQDDESTCPECGKLGQYKGKRDRELLTLRGPATLAEPEYYCSACRRSFFPDDQRDGG
jgi:hypothetical protein